MSQSDLSSVPISMLDLITFVMFTAIQIDRCLNVIGCRCCFKPGQETASYLTCWCVTMNSINFCFASKDMNRKNSSIEKVRSSVLENDQN